MTQLVDEGSSVTLVSAWRFGRASLAHELLGESRCWVGVRIDAFVSAFSTSPQGRRRLVYFFSEEEGATVGGGSLAFDVRGSLYRRHPNEFD